MEIKFFENLENKTKFSVECFGKLDRNTIKFEKKLKDLNSKYKESAEYKREFISLSERYINIQIEILDAIIKNIQEILSSLSNFGEDYLIISSIRKDNEEFLKTSLNLRDEHLKSLGRISVLRNL